MPTQPATFTNPRTGPRAIAAAACSIPRASSGAPRRQGGFSFTEVLFAVMILGIGFIMVAAIFPVAIQQTKLTGEEVQASTTARGGVNIAQQIGLDAGALYNSVLVDPPRTVPAGETLSVDGMVCSFRDERFPDMDNFPPPVGNGPLVAEDFRDRLWRQISGNLILPSDNRAGMVVLYRRGMTFYNPTGGDLAHTDADVQRQLHPYAQVWVIGMQSRNRSAFELTRDARRWPNDGPGAGASGFHGTLEGKLIRCKLYEGDLLPDRISFNDYFTENHVDEPAAAEGAYVIISDDEFLHVNPGDADQDNTTTVLETNGQSNGRVYRLGSKVGPGVWELAPGEDMTLINPDGNTGNGDDIHENIPPRQVNPTEAAPLATGVPAQAFIVGRGYVNVEDPTQGYDGPSQATGVYTSFIPAN